MEIEAKYRAVKRIKAGQVEAVDLGPYTLGPRIKHNLRDTLLDTDDLAISLQQYALRVRRDGALSFVTLKGPAIVEGGTHKREEWEVLVVGGPEGSVRCEGRRGRHGDRRVGGSRVCGGVGWVRLQY